MSIDVKRKLISESINTLEQGEFQDFCCSFLRIYDKKYSNLVRHGGTASGKTRKGIPDLLSTDDNGNNLAIQCSTNSKYWRKPNDETKYKTWKPIADIQECLDELENLIGIGLCSNIEIPTNLSNLKSELIKYTKSNTNAQLTIFSLVDFESELIENTDKYIELIKSCLPAIYHFFVDSKLSSAEVKLEVYKRIAAPLPEIEKIVEDIFKNDDPNTDHLQLALTASSGIKSRFQIDKLPENPSIFRTESFGNYLDSIEGKIISIVGIPKIGKTSWVIQNCHDYSNDGYQILWFDSPYGKENLIEFYSDVSRIVLSKFIDNSIANDFSDNRITDTDLLKHISQVSTSNKYLIIIDNAELLEEDIATRFNKFFDIIKQPNLQSNYSVILISNRSLKNTYSKIDHELRCPIWNQHELKSLIESNNINVTNNLDSYCELLTAKSGGHPLYAIALARKAPSIAKLITYTNDQYAPELSDKDLTFDIKKFLFEDMLSEPDYRNFIIRLSPLIYRHDKLLIQKLCDEIDPTISTPIKLIIEKLDRSIIEGDDKTGFGIPLVFKDVARTYLVNSKRNEILDKASIHLLEPTNNLVDVRQYIEGIYYSAISKNLDRAFLHTSIILYNSCQKTNDESEIKYLLSRLDFITFIDIPQNINTKKIWIFTLFNFANANAKIGKHVKAVELYNKILDQGLYVLNTSNYTDPIFNEIYNSLLGYIITYFTSQSKFNEALKIVDNINVDNITEDNFNIIQFLDILNLLIQKSDPSNFPKYFLYKYLDKISIHPIEDDTVWGDIAACFQALGLKLSKENTSLGNQDILKTISDNQFENQIWNLFINITIAQYDLELRDNESTIKIIDSILHQFKNNNLKSEFFESKLYMMKGDTYFKDSNARSAATNYRKASHLLPNIRTDFDHAWIHYRLGVCTNDNHEALLSFDKAKKYFTDLGSIDFTARCEGEKSIVYYLDNQYIKTVETIELTLKELVSGKFEYNPTVTIGMSLLIRLNFELRRQDLPNDEDNINSIFPEFKKGLFENILKTAKPKSTGANAWYIISECYEYLDVKDKQIELLNDLLNLQPEIRDDYIAKLLAISNLLEIYIEENNIEEINRVINILVNTQPNYTDSRILQPLSIFKQIDMLLKDNNRPLTQYDNLLDIIEKNINQLDDEKTQIWKSEIYKRKAGLNGVTSKDQINEDNLTKAYTYALECNHHELVVELGHIIGFERKSLVNSIKKLGELHLEIIYAICNANRSEDVKINNLVTVGDNLYKLWLAISPQRHIESDYPFLINVKNRAKNLQGSKVIDSLIPPLMILLLISLAYDKSKYEYAINWAIDNLKANTNVIPKDELKYLQQFNEI